MKTIILPHYVRVTKITAERLYKNGYELYICGVNKTPYDSCWKVCNQYKEFWNQTFNNIVAVFTHYLCNSVNGRYPAFYMDRDAYDTAINRPFCE